MKAGWEVKALGEVCEIHSGAGFPKDLQGEGVGEYPFFKVGDMNADGNEQALIVANNYVSDAVRRDLGAKLIAPGSVVFPKVGGAIATNKKRKIVIPSCVDNNVMGLTPRIGRIVPDYLSWWLDGFDIYEFSNKAALPSITKATVEAWPIPLPPLDEQKRIVAVLDAAFEGLTRARAHTETNLQNARELFESALGFEILPNKRDWAEYTLGDVCQFVGGSQPPKSDFLPNPGDGLVRLIQIRDYKSDAKAVYIPIKLARRFCNPEDIMIGRYGPPIFQILRGIEGAYNVALMKAVPIEKLMSKNFLFYFLKNREILQYVIDASSRAAGQDGVNKDALEAYPISLPSTDEQVAIVARLEGIQANSRELDRHYRAKLADLDALRQSLLQKAFAGELT